MKIKKMLYFFVMRQHQEKLDNKSARVIKIFVSIYMKIQKLSHFSCLVELFKLLQLYLLRLTY